MQRSVVELTSSRIVLFRSVVFVIALLFLLALGFPLSFAACVPQVFRVWADRIVALRSLHLHPAFRFRSSRGPDPPPPPPPSYGKCDVPFPQLSFSFDATGQPSRCISRACDVFFIYFCHIYIYFITYRFILYIFMLLLIMLFIVIFLEIAFKPNLSLVCAQY